MSMAHIRVKPDPQRYSFDGFGSAQYPNLMLLGAGDLDNWTLKTYRDKWEGYQALGRALKMEPSAVTAEVKVSDLRRRGR